MKHHIPAIWLTTRKRHYPLRVWHNEHSAPLRLFLIFRNQIPVNTPEYHHDERSKYHDSASSTLCGRGY
ncbi:hypothetical protein HMPREF9346_05186 [Escherichia coli MS 119-7]|nr:hypothetical protein HMPREF9346_05186 [Escherichia coli MS 119-7]